jgi:hypothetical protein
MRAELAAADAYQVKNESILRAKLSQAKRIS